MEYTEQSLKDLIDAHVQAAIDELKVRLHRAKVKFKADHTRTAQGFLQAMDIIKEFESELNKE